MRRHTLRTTNLLLLFLLLLSAALRAEDGSPSLAISPHDAQAARQHQQAWAKLLKVDLEIKDSLGLELRLIPPGEFQMGAAKGDDQASTSEAPQHRVRITKPLYFDNRSLVGTMDTTSPHRSESFEPTVSASTTCTVMPASGAMTGLVWPITR